MGFSFHYIPTKSLKIGTLIKSYDTLNTKLDTKELGKFMIYVSMSNLKEHKNKIKLLIRKNYNKSVPQLIDILNPIIKGFSNYYSWGQSYRYLSYLNFYLYKRIMVYLKKKFKKTSVRHIVDKYFLDNWTLTGSYMNPKKNDYIRNRHNKYLQKYTNLKIIPIQKGLLGNSLKNLDYFSNSIKYAKRNCNIWKHLKSKKL